MKSQQTEIMNSEVTGDTRPTPQGKWVIGGGKRYLANVDYRAKKCKK